MNPLHRSAADETLIASTNERVVGRSLLGATRDPSRRLPALALMGLMLVCCLVLSNVSFAGTGGTEFNPAYTTITDWLQGDLGRLIAASLLVVGLVMGVVRQSIMAAVPAIACGLVATVAPTIIGAVVTAVI
jgi:conjugal transfer pilus assembly protein TraA